MFHLVYASTAVRLYSSNELLDWLYEFRIKNASLGITGLLLYKDASFMQALEGDEDTVRKLYASIRDDKRHRNVNTLLTISVAQRQFPDWRMGFKNLDGLDLSSVEGYKSPRELPPWVDVLPWRASVAMKMLAVFNETGVNNPGEIQP